MVYVWCVHVYIKLWCYDAIDLRRKIKIYQIQIQIQILWRIACVCACVCRCCYCTKPKTIIFFHFRLLHSRILARHHRRSFVSLHLLCWSAYSKYLHKLHSRILICRLVGRCVIWKMNGNRAYSQQRARMIDCPTQLYSSDQRHQCVDDRMMW